MAWTKQELEQLKKLFPNSLVKELKALFPDKKWNAIYQMGKKLGLSRTRARDDSQYKDVYGDRFSWYLKEDGYIIICGKAIGPPKYRMYEHRYVWEKFHGPIPKDHEIHHVDGDRTNNTIENLECLHKSHHHSRDREVRKSMTEFLKQEGLYDKWLKINQ